jgi:hypothetical protein
MQPNSTGNTHLAFPPSQFADDAAKPGLLDKVRARI